MKTGDRFIQSWRIRLAARWIPQGARVLDIGCHQGEFFKWMDDKISPSVGVDPLCKETATLEGHQFFSASLQDCPPFESNSFDAIVLLATIEHIRDKTVIARETARLLRAGGRVIITAPSLMVDKILDILLSLRIVDGMSLEEHHGFTPDELIDIFTAVGFQLIKKQKFEMGLNNLYVFERL